MKKKKKTPVLDLYRKLCETKKLSWENGLCNEICTELSWACEERFKKLFTPTQKEERALRRRGYCDAYWATSLKRDDDGLASTFCGGREIFLLLFACTEGEL